MPLERQKKIESIFYAAVYLDERARAEYVRAAAAGDAALAAEVEAMIEAHRREDEKAQQELDAMTGRLVGRYRITGELGRGGMGAVYAAERADGTFRTRAAIKLVKRGMDTDAILRRFRNERQILATLNHPNVARLLDGGTTEDGLPYFVMEYIEGRPLFDYCRAHELDLRERLELFRQICDAVEAAHEIKVVHRDLKPSNILVKPDGTVKLLDFGIAKLLDPELAAATIEMTLTQWRMLTPQFASPEQIYGGPITFASDVYSLGVLLYELVAGEPPYRFASHAPHELSRVICEQPPRAPSAVPGFNFQLSPAGAKGRPAAQAEAEAFDKIVLKALRKKPAERYQTAAELGEDVDNLLAGRPVKAEFFTAAADVGHLSLNQYKTKRSIAILPFKMLGGGRADDTDEFLGIGLADALVSRLSGVQRLVVRPTSSVLAFAEENPMEAGRRIDVDFVLDGSIRRAGDRIRVTVQLLNIAEGSTRWAEKFDENFTDVLELEDVISERVAKVLLPQLTGEERRRLGRRGTNDPEAYQAYLRGRYYANQFTDESLLKSVDAYREAIRLDASYALPHVGIADFYVWSAIFGKIPAKEAFPQAKKAIQKALEIENSLGEAHALLAFVTMLYDWDWAAAEPLARRALELSPNYYFSHEAYSAILATQGNVYEARDEIVRAEELDPLSPRAKLMTSWTYYQTRDFPRALEKAQQANEMQKDFAQGFLHLSNALVPLGRAGEAIELLRGSLPHWNESGMPRYMICFALVEAGRRAEARAVLDEMLALGEKTFMMPYFVAMAYTALGDFDEAFRWFAKAVDERSVWLAWFGTEPKLDALRDDPRYLDILRRTNNPIAAREADPATGEPATGGREKSIAVLPFKILAAAGDADAEDEFLGVGLADAVTMRLSNVRQFLVRPTRSVLSFTAQDADPFVAGRELGVEYVVDGNVRRVGNRIRVAAQLLSVGEHATRWAQRFDEDYTDVLALEDSISERVTTSLLPKLSGEEQQRLKRRGTDSPEAYEAYMRARFFYNQFTPETYPQAIEWAEKATRLDPRYAVAYAGLAQFYNWASIFGFISPAEGHRKTRAAAERAIELDPSLADAYAVLGFTIGFAQWNYDEAERLFQKAIALNPNDSLFYEWYAVVHAGRGDFAEGVRTIRRAEELEPLSQRQMIITAWTLYQLQQPEAALAKAEQVVEMIPDYWQGHTQKGNALEVLGRADEAVESLRRALELAPGMLIVQFKLCHALVRAGREREAREALREIESVPANLANNPYLVGAAYAAFGDRDAAFACFERAIEQRDLWLVWLPTEPKLDALRDDPRFESLLRRINFKPLAPRPRRAPEPKKSLAVLPFKVIGAGEEFLGVGLADALVTRFSNFKRFIVRPTSSVLAFGGETDALAAGRSLSVEYVVEGNIRLIGDRIRVTAQLLNVGEAATVWSQPFDERYTDALALEDSISEKVAKSLLPQFSGADARELKRRGTNSPKAYEAFLKGRYYLNSMTEETLRKAVGFFEEAIELDPAYALAYTSLAEIYIYFGIQCLMPFAECSRRAREVAEKAISLDPTLAEAHAALGFAMLNTEHDWQAGALHFRRALQANPDSMTGHFWMETYYLQMRRYDEALAEARKVLEIEPNSLLGWHLLGWIHYHAKRYSEAIEAHAHMLASPSPYAFGYFTYSWALRLAGRHEEAVAEAENAIAAAPGNPMYRTALAAALAARGRRDEAARELARVIERAPEKYVSPYLLATVYIALGDRDRTFAQLRESAAIHDTWIHWIAVDPQFESLRDDARFQEIMRLIKHPLAEPEKKN